MGSFRGKSSAMARKSIKLQVGFISVQRHHFFKKRVRWQIKERERKKFIEFFFFFL